MKTNGRFLLGVGGVALVVTWLVWTGVSEAGMPYLTPTELLAKVTVDPGLHDSGVKVSGRVAEDSYTRGEDADGPFHRFVVEDLESTGSTFPVVYRNPLPDTFHPGGEVVVEGRYGSDGLFQAATVLTKCGSRYEALPEGSGATHPEGIPIQTISRGAGAGYGAGDAGAEGG